MIERHFRSIKHSRLLNQHQCLGDSKVMFHSGLSVLTYLGTMMLRVETDDVKNLRRMTVRYRRKRTMLVAPVDGRLRRKYAVAA